MKKPIVYGGRPGAGKSKQSKQNVMDNKSKHLFVCPTQMLVKECEADLLSLADGAFPIKAIYSDQQQKGGYYLVRDRLAHRIAHAASHSCTIITQASFLDLDLSVFDGWHLHLDELIGDAVKAGEIYSPSGILDLGRLFRLDQQSDNYSILHATDALNVQDLINDVHALPEIKNLANRVRSKCPVVIDCLDLEEIRNRPCKWHSVWTLETCSAFERVEISASDVTESLMHRVSPRDYEHHDIAPITSKASVLIRYFDNGGLQCSSHYWCTNYGRQQAAAVGRFMSGLPMPVGYWTTNECLKDLLGAHMRTGYVPPKQDGTNSLRSQTSCAIIFSSKAQRYEDVLRSLNCNLDLRAISEAREGNAIWQLAMRGAVRDPDYSGDYTVYVFDRHQADRLAKKFVANGYANTRIEWVKEACVEARQVVKKGRPKNTGNEVQRRAAR